MTENKTLTGPIYKGKVLPDLLADLATPKEPFVPDFDPTPEPNPWRKRGRPTKKEVKAELKTLRNKEREKERLAHRQAEVALLPEPEVEQEPKRFMLTPILRSKLNYRRAEANHIVDRLIERAVKGELPAINEIWNRLDGKPTERHEVDDHRPIILNFVPAEQVLAHRQLKISVEGEAKELPEGVQNG